MARRGSTDNMNRTDSENRAGCSKEKPIYNLRKWCVSGRKK